MNGDPLDPYNPALHGSDGMPGPRAPQPFPCHACTHKYAGAVCPICKEDRPAYAAIKAMAPARQLLPPCTYAPNSLCGCELRGLCLEDV